MKKLVFICFLLCCLPLSGFAKNLYVSTTGNDAITYANNDINNPWLTPEKGWRNSLAGDTVYFRSGTYTISSQIITKYNANNGTAGNPITFTSYTGEQAVFTTALTGYVFGIQKEYNHVSNINFNGASPTWFELGEDLSAAHFEVRNCNVVLGTGGDNTGFVKSNTRSDYLVVEDCIIEGPGIGVGIHLNTSCIYIGGSDYISIKNNTLHTAPIGLYWKIKNDANSGNEVAYNYIYNTSRNSIQTNSIYTNFHDNIIGANNAPWQVNEANGFDAGDNNTINHNTIFSGGLVFNSALDGADNNTVTNNIISARTPCCDGNTWNYNMYVSGAAIGVNDLANTSPTYVGGVTPSTIAGFALTIASAGYQAGSDSKDMGADVTAFSVDTTPAILTNTTSATTISCTSSSMTFSLTLTSSEAATLKWSLTGQAYSTMENTFSTTGGMSHSTLISQVCDLAEIYYVRSSDASGNVNTMSTEVTVTTSARVGATGIRTTGTPISIGTTGTPVTITN